MASKNELQGEEMKYRSYSTAVENNSVFILDGNYNIPGDFLDCVVPREVPFFGEGCHYAGLHFSRLHIERGKKG